MAHLAKLSIFPIRNPTMLPYVLYGSPLPFVQTQCHWEIVKQIVKSFRDSLSPYSHIPPCPPFANTFDVS